MDLTNIVPCNNIWHFSSVISIAQSSFHVVGDHTLQLFFLQDLKTLKFCPKLLFQVFVAAQESIDVLQFLLKVMRIDTFWWTFQKGKKKKLICIKTYLNNGIKQYDNK